MRTKSSSHVSKIYSLLLLSLHFGLRPAPIAVARSPLETPYKWPGPGRRTWARRAANFRNFVREEICSFRNPEGPNFTLFRSRGPGPAPAPSLTDFGFSANFRATPKNTSENAYIFAFGPRISIIPQCIFTLQIIRFWAVFSPNFDTAKKSAETGQRNEGFSP